MQQIAQGKADQKKRDREADPYQTPRVLKWESHRLQQVTEALAAVGAIHLYDIPRSGGDDIIRQEDVDLAGIQAERDATARDFLQTYNTPSYDARLSDAAELGPHGEAIVAARQEASQHLEPLRDHVVAFPTTNVFAGRDTKVKAGDPGAPLDKTLETVRKHLHPSDPFIPVIDSILERMGENVGVYVVPDAGAIGLSHSLSGSARMNTETRDEGDTEVLTRIQEVFMRRGLIGTPDAINLLVHESVHVVSAGALRTDPVYLERMTALYDKALAEFYKNPTDSESRPTSLLNAKKPYGLLNVKEFVAEAYANERFTAWLDGIEGTKAMGTSRPTSLLSQFVTTVRGFLGLPEASQTLLQEIITLGLPSKGQNAAAYAAFVRGQAARTGRRLRFQSDNPVPKGRRAGGTGKPQSFDSAEAYTAAKPHLDSGLLHPLDIPFTGEGGRHTLEDVNWAVETAYADRRVDISLSLRGRPSPQRSQRPSSEYGANHAAIMEARAKLSKGLDYLRRYIATGGVLEGDPQPRDTDVGYPIRDLLQSWQDELHPEDPYIPVINSIEENMGSQVDLMLLPDSEMMAPDGQSIVEGVHYNAWAPNWDEDVAVRRQVVFLRRGLLDSSDAIGVALHEMKHGMTVKALRNIPEYRERMEEQYQQALRHYEDTQAGTGIKPGNAYRGLVNLFEFVAEAYTSESFQEFLAGAQKIGTTQHEGLTTLMIHNAQREMLGIPLDAPESLLSSTLAAGMPGRAANAAGFDIALEGVRTDSGRTMIADTDWHKTKTPGSGTEKGAGKAEPTPEELEAKWGPKIVEAKEALDEILAAPAPETPKPSAVEKVGAALVGEKVRVAHLASTTFDHLVSTYRKYFDVKGQENPLVLYDHTKRQEQADARAHQRPATDILERWRTIPQAAQDALNSVMLDATYMQVDPSVAWEHSRNAVTRGKRGRLTVLASKKAHVRLHADFKKLTPAAQQMYRDARDSYAETFAAMRDLIIGNTLDMYDAKAYPGLLDRVMRAKTAAEIRDIPAPIVKRGGKVVKLPSWDKVTKSLGKLANIANQNGPYFPVMRYGDYALEHSYVETSKPFASKATARIAAAQTRADTPGVKTTGAKEGPNGWTYDTKYEGFSMYETKAEAYEAQAKLVGENYNVGAVTKTIDRGADSSGVVGDLMSLATRKLTGKDGEKARAALHEAVMSLLPETSMQQHMRQRQNVLGAGTNMQRNFAQYSKTAGWHLATLKHRQTITEAYNGVINARKEASKGGAGENRKALIISNVGDEVIARHDRGFTQPGLLSRAASNLAFFNFLMSLSYSAVNSMQTIILTLPHLSKYGSAKAAKALATAYKDISPDIGKQLWKTKGGLDALHKPGITSMNSMVDDIIARLDVNTGRSKMLAELAARGDVDATFSLEMAEVARSGDAKGTVRSVAGATKDRVLEAGRTLPYITEVMNRAVTALATYDLSVGSGMSHEEATEESRRAVIKTQGDYSGYNRPRLFVKNDLLRAMTLYKMYPLIVYQFAIDNLRKIGDPNLRTEGAKTLAMTAVAHGAFAGVAGSLLAEPIRLVMHALAWAFDDEPEVQEILHNPGVALRKAIYDATGDKKLAEVVTHGIPRAFGIDMSRRVGAANMLISTSEGETPLDTVVSTVIDTALGPILGTGNNYYRGFKHLIAGGDVARGVEMMAPKGAKDIMRGLRMGTEGMTTSSGDTLIAADKFTTRDKVVAGVGFSTSKEANVHEARSIYRRLLRRISNQRSRLMADEKRGDFDAKAVRKFNAGLPDDLFAQYHIGPSDGYKVHLRRTQKQSLIRGGVQYTKPTLGVSRDLDYLNLSND